MLHPIREDLSSMESTCMHHPRKQYRILHHGSRLGDAFIVDKQRQPGRDPRRPMWSIDRPTEWRKLSKQTNQFEADEADRRDVGIVVRNFFFGA